MNHYNPRYSPSHASSTNLEEVFAMLQQHERQLSTSSTSNSNSTSNMTAGTLPPNTLNGNENNNNNNMDDSATNVLANLLAITWLFVFMWFCCRGRPPGPEHWRGAEIRRRYQELLARERAKKDRKQQTTEYRRRLVQHNLHTRTVIAKDEEGNWTLGPVNYRVQDLANVSTTTRSTADSQEYDPNAEEEEEDDENEYSCVICLEPFHVGDVVSWSRFSEDCHHVYHADCIQPWLEGKRQDECPSCRNRLMIQEPPQSTNTTNNTENDENGSDGNAATDAEGEGDIETGANHNNAQQQQQEQQQVDDEEDELNKDEEDSFFVIMHGLISRVAKRASYTLIGTKDSMDEKDLSLLPPASPFRRVVSYEPMRSSPTTISPRSRPNSFTRPVDLSLPATVTPSSSSSSSSLLQTIQAVQSFESDESNNSEDRDVIPEQIPFRRVQSDIVGTTTATSRQQHHHQQQQHKKTILAIPTTPSNMRLSVQGTLAPATTAHIHDNKDTISNTSPLTTHSDCHDELHNDTLMNPTDRPVISEDVAPAKACENHETCGTHTTKSTNDTTTPTENDDKTPSSISEPR